MRPRRPTMARYPPLHATSLVRSNTDRPTDLHCRAVIQCCRNCSPHAEVESRRLVNHMLMRRISKPDGEKLASPGKYTSRKPHAALTRSARGPI